jgi:diadenosine tetraphosphatase ApaH/serine/threonine PP2A family protein phosphatase
LTATFDHLATEGVDSVLCLGDIVGYGADPSACIKAIRERARVVVAGNHDRAAAGLEDLESFNPYARIAAEWTSALLSDEERAYLAGLPLKAEVEDATLVHASPFHPESWDYLISERDGETALSAFETRLCFIGHSHRPAAWIATETGARFFPCVERMTHGPWQRLLVNVGSVGQPRDRDPRAAYVVWDAGTGDITLHRVAYDVAAAQAKIMKAGLPRFLADRLANGQ